MNQGVRVSAWTIVVVVVVTLCGRAGAQAPTPPPTAVGAGPIDRVDDAQLSALRQLDWKSADINALAPAEKCAALEALNHGLNRLGGKLDGRADLLIDYIDQNQLGAAYAAAKANPPAMKPITFEQMEQLAAAYIKSPQGAAAFGSNFADSSPSMLDRYATLYENSARREFADVMEGRFHVRSMGQFVQDVGRADDFRTWAAAEVQRRQAAYAAKQAQIAQQQAAEAAKKQQQQQQAEEALAQVMGDMSNEPKPVTEAQNATNQPIPPASAQVGDAGPATVSMGPTFYDNNGWWPPVSYGGGYYYNDAAYRANMNEKAANAYDRWGRAGGVGAAGVGGGRVGGVGGVRR